MPMKVSYNSTSIEHICQYNIDFQISTYVRISICSLDSLSIMIRGFNMDFTIHIKMWVTEKVYILM